MKASNITQIAKKILKHQKGLREHQIIHPGREWAIGILLALFSLVLIVGWNVYSYDRYSSDEITNIVPDTQEVVVYREQMVAEALAIFSERSNTFVKLRNDFFISSAPEPFVEELVELIPEESLEQTNQSEEFDAQPSNFENIILR